MVRSKMLMSALGVATLAFVGVANAAPTELSLAQMDSVTAAGVGSSDNCYNGNGRKLGLHKQEINLALQSNIALVSVSGDNVTINGGIHIQQSNRLTQVIY